MVVPIFCSLKSIIIAKCPMKNPCYTVAWALEVHCSIRTNLNLLAIETLLSEDWLKRCRSLLRLPRLDQHNIQWQLLGCQIYWPPVATFQNLMLHTLSIFPPPAFIYFILKTLVTKVGEVAGYPDVELCLHTRTTLLSWCRSLRTEKRSPLYWRISRMHRNTHKSGHVSRPATRLLESKFN